MRTALTVTIRVTGKWWKGKAWAAIKGLAPEWLIEMLEVFVKILPTIEEQALAPIAGVAEGTEDYEWRRTVEG